MKFPLLIFFIAFAPFSKRAQNLDYQMDKQRENIISSCLDNIVSKGENLSDLDGRRYLDCTIYMVENELISSFLKPVLNGENVCILDKAILFQLGIQNYLEVKKLSIYSDSAEVDIHLHPFTDFELKLSKRGDLWLVH